MVKQRLSNDLMNDDREKNHAGQTTVQCRQHIQHIQIVRMVLNTNDCNSTPSSLSSTFLFQSGLSRETSLIPCTGTQAFS